MELYDLMKNIRNISKEDEIIKAIAKTKEKLNGLTEERMCKVYSSAIYDELQKAHVSSRIIKTTDLMPGYDHTFVLVPENSAQEKYYLIDLTISQFPKEQSGVFTHLENNGYQLINNDTWFFYLQHITNNKEITCSLDEAYYHSLNKKNYKNTTKI